MEMEPPKILKNPLKDFDAFMRMFFRRIKKDVYHKSVMETFPSLLRDVMFMDHVNS